MTATTLTQQQIRQGLTVPGVYLGSNQFTFSIPGASSNWGYYDQGTEPFVDYAPLLASQATLFRSAIGAWDALILPDFVEVAETASSWGEIRVGYTGYSEMTGSAGYAYFPLRSAPLDIGSDIWINREYLDPGSDQSYLPSLFLHEIGHAVGLKHSFEPPAIPADYDSERYSVMSYTTVPQLVKTFTSLGPGRISAEYSYVTPATPMVLDVAAIQYLYGADPDTGAGDTVYSFVQGDPALRTIYDAGGIDTFDFSGFTRANNIDLRPGAYSSVGIWSIGAQIAYWTAQFPGFASFISEVLNETDPPTYTWTDNLGIAFSTTIENVVGGAAADTFLGNDAGNRITGGLGNDLIDGGAGLDVAVFSGSRDGYDLTHFGAGRVRVSGADGVDMLVGVERLQFSDALVAAPVNLLNLPTLALTAFGAGASAGSWTSAGLYPRTAADVNGDGLADIIGFGDGGVSIALATGSGAYANPLVTLTTFGAGAGAGSWTNASLYPRTTADVNGDGLADIVGFGDGGVSVALAAGGGAFASPFIALAAFGASARAGGWTDNGLYPRLLADVNGDGRADIVGFGDGGVSVALATGGGFFANPVLALATFGASARAGGWSSDDLYPRTAADVDGDGNADLIGFGDGGVYLAISNGDGTFATANLELATFGAGAGAGSWSTNSLYPRIFADVDGDGTADLIGFGEGGTLVSLASGFDIIA